VAKQARYFRASAGPVLKGVFNLYQHQDGEFAPRVPESYRWGSVGAYYDFMKVGLSPLVADINALSRHIGEQAPSVVKAALTPTFALSQKYCPKDTNSLVNSGELEVRDRGTRSGALCEITYARNGQPFYAVFVHEIASYKHTPPTSWKFLERAIKEDMPNIAKRIEVYSKLLVGAGGLI
jgi:hypothetical protein